MKCMRSQERQDGCGALILAHVYGSIGTGSYGSTGVGHVHLRATCLMLYRLMLRLVSNFEVYGGPWQDSRSLDLSHEPTLDVLSVYLV
jgi:hypothetical protein